MTFNLRCVISNKLRTTKYSNKRPIKIRETSFGKKTIFNRRSRKLQNKCRANKEAIRGVHKNELQLTLRFLYGKKESQSKTDGTDSSQML